MNPVIVEIFQKVLAFKQQQDQSIISHVSSLFFTPVFSVRFVLPPHIVVEMIVFVGDVLFFPSVCQRAGAQ